MAALLNLENIDTVHFKKKDNPYPVRSGANDAWCSGYKEGRFLWKINTEHNDYGVTG